MIEKEFYTAPEVAKMLGISHVAVFKKIKKGQIKAEKIGRNFVIRKKELANILGESLTPEDKKIIEEGVEKTFAEYGEVLKKLGKE